ncbi:hypothetical protein [Sciscionella sediminilitoris]|uniref:hypothetical protein n=1 Tax=Sciscionella sediminilitoris TaxID=1445613 RepID=UPI0004DF03CA|nr:hypothetical protein [Sciscionella sp. SE31]
MPLDIRFEEDIQGLRDAADYIRQMSKFTHEAGTAAIAANVESEDGWGGQSGTAFREYMSAFGGDTDKVGEGAGKLAQGFDQAADGYNHVKMRFAQAREVAAAAGLRTTDTQIFEPGPAPAAPGPLPQNPTPEQTQANQQATEAQSAHQAQLKAFKEAQQTVTEATKSKQETQSFLLDLIGGNPIDSGLKIIGTSASLGGLPLAASQKYRDAALKLWKNVEDWREILSNPRATPEMRLKAALSKDKALTEAMSSDAKAGATAAQRFMNRMPKSVRVALNGIEELGADVGKNAGPILKGAMPVLKRVPIAGTAITAFGIGMDIGVNGADPAKSVISGTGGLIAGTATGAAIGGPVGLVVGAVAGAGVSYAVDHYDDIKQPITDGFYDVTRGINKVF